MRCGVWISSAVWAVALLCLPQTCANETSDEYIRPADGVAVSSASALISELYPAAVADDEYLKIRSTASEELALRGWSLTDGEGTLTFVSEAMLGPGEEISISFNSSSYLAAYGSYPDFRLDDPDASHAIAISGSLILSDTGDSVVLADPSGEEVDSVFYGDVSIAASSDWIGLPVPKPRSGEVLKRSIADGHVVDTDGAPTRDELDPRLHRRARAGPDVPGE